MNQYTLPTGRHRYDRRCNCEPCLMVRAVLMQSDIETENIEPPPLSDAQLQSLLDACHDFGTLHSGAFPTLPILKKAQAEGRLFAKDHSKTGVIHIRGIDACHITFDVE